MLLDADALVIGAGPAGAATAIWLAGAGWRVVLVEQHAYPRQKVCGECLSAGSLSLLDALGVGAAVREIAGPELRRVGWIGARATVVAPFPPCTAGADRYGRAIGRDRLDELLLERARGMGVEVLQPATVRAVAGGPGRFVCTITGPRQGRHPAADEHRTEDTRRARVVIDAHGSWESAPTRTDGGAVPRIVRAARRGADLFAFKASLRNTALPPGLLAVISFAGGYGGIVIADGGRTTLACCIRRDRLAMCRARLPGATAGTAVGEHLGRSCSALHGLLDAAQHEGQWLSVGPIQPGIRVGVDGDIFRVGNAAGEAHPLIGEGISMALQSAGLLADHLLSEPAARLDRRRTHALNRRYAAAWRDAFTTRLRFAAWYAHTAMHPVHAAAAQLLLRRWPPLLTGAARWAGKARRPIVRITAIERRA
ncbi:MAG TPA: FAD-dependent oxidoreductase [Steroidobacteraceae bacterium]|nr:FAD-dependent oxidoreductase [Steroidobacteraceae bacterium]